MKTIFLSFSPEWYKYIVSGEKIYEHRKRFTKEPVVAYLYLGIPIQQIVAIIELGERIEISSWLEKYRDNQEAVERIQKSLCKNRYAMEIRSVQFIRPIDIKKVINAFPEFHIPQSFFYLDNKKEIFEFLKKETVKIGSRKDNTFYNVDVENICKY